jgi:alpha-tubulin suppressor-like RCC1 family protein
VAIGLSYGDTSCAVSGGGGLWCWGKNFDQAGTGQPYQSATRLPGPARTVTISGGGAHLCALVTGGTVECWGLDDVGQTGRDSLAFASSPAAVPGLQGVTSLASGYLHNCALKSDTTIDCWGSNEFGQLGNSAIETGPPTTTHPSYSAAPVPVTGLTGALGLAVARGHGCAIVAEGKVQCWGDNTLHQLGNAGLTAALSLAPVEVTGLTGVAALALGNFHSCALRSDGGVTCWGTNLYGQLGSGAPEAGPLGPVSVLGLGTGPGLEAATAVAAGTDHACALLASGGVRCWGLNARGQLGDGQVEAGVATPVDVANLTGVTAISAGFEHTCALLEGVGVRCWGGNAWGQLGNGGQVMTPVPVEVIF